jgi:hypothetical protein
MPNEAQRRSLDEFAGPKKMYWVWGKDGKRRGPASLNRDEVRIMEKRGAKCVLLGRGEFYTTELRNYQ